MSMSYCGIGFHEAIYDTNIKHIDTYFKSSFVSINIHFGVIFAFIVEYLHTR